MWCWNKVYWNHWISPMKIRQTRVNLSTPLPLCTPSPLFLSWHLCLILLIILLSTQSSFSCSPPSYFPVFFLSISFFFCSFPHVTCPALSPSLYFSRHLLFELTEIAAAFGNFLWNRTWIQMLFQTFTYTDRDADSGVSSCSDLGSWGFFQCIVS